MTADNQWLEKLSPDLFWDVAREQVDTVKNRRWLVERVLTRGRVEDWQLLTQNLGYAALRELSPRLKLDRRERHFLDWILEAHNA